MHNPHQRRRSRVTRQAEQEETSVADIDGRHCATETTQVSRPTGANAAHISAMDRIFMFIGDFSGDYTRGFGDSMSDQLNSFMTPFVLFVFALVISAKYFIDEPINCWCPAHFTEGQETYTNKVCWTTNTYFLPFHKQIPRERDPKRYIGYYQWMPLILVCQAVMFYVPRPIWRLLNKKSGIAVSTITDAAIECQRKTDTDDRDRTIRYMSKHMGRFLLELHKNYQMSDRCKSLWLAIYGNYLLILYMFIKVLYIVNVIGQLFLLDRFLGGDYHWYGPEVASKMARGLQWSSSERFPRVTLCDLRIRVLGNVQRYTIQCALPMNLYNEILFIFVWFWFVFVALVTVVSLAIWIATSLHAPYNRKYVTTRLVAMEELENLAAKRAEISVFVSDFLKRDGCFILRMVGKNASDIIAAELIVKLWKFFSDNNKHFHKLSSTDAELMHHLADET